MKNPGILQKLKIAGYKLTLQRLLVIDVLKTHKKHLTPADVYQLAKSKNNNIGLVTVYRTLEILEVAGIICRINNPEGQTGYVLRKPQGHHHHILCQKCDLVVDFANCNVNEIENNVAIQTGFVVKQHCLEFIGLCPTCR